MVNKIGPITIDKLTDYVRSGSSLSLSGFMITQKSFNEIFELFRKAPGNVVINTLVGGHEIGFDKTDDRVLTQYCIFTQERIPDGWYILTSFSFEPQKPDGYFPFSCTLFYAGTNYLVQLGLSIFILKEETNDWGI